MTTYVALKEVWESHLDLLRDCRVNVHPQSAASDD